VDRGATSSHSNSQPAPGSTGSTTNASTVPAVAYHPSSSSRPTSVSARPRRPHEPHSERAYDAQQRSEPRFKKRVALPTRQQASSTSRQQSQPRESPTNPGRFNTARRGGHVDLRDRGCKCSALPSDLGKLYATLPQRDHGRGTSSGQSCKIRVSKSRSPTRSAATTYPLWIGCLPVAPSGSRRRRSRRSLGG
jgi:hypothetical protein